MRQFLYIIILCFAFAATAGAGVYTGDNNNNTFLLSGNGHLGQFTATLVNPYSGYTVAIDDEKYINDSYYDGLGGTDTLYGTAYGDVVMLCDAQGAQMIANIETLSFGNGGDIVIFSDATIVLGGITVYGGALDDIIWGNAGADYLDGNLGNDLVDGGPGTDIIIGGDGDDHLWGGTGDDVFRYAVGHDFDIIEGGSEFDTIEFNGITAEDITITPNVTIGTMTGFQITVAGGGWMRTVDVEQLRFQDGRTMLIPEPATGVILLMGAGMMRVRKKHGHRLNIEE